MADAARFLTRWARLKQRAQSSPSAADATAATARAAEAPEAPAQELPPIESLTADSDFSVFMRPGVPEPMRLAALRKLWASDPVLANLDGLVEYGEDFNEPFRLGGTVATAYRVLRGMPAGDDKSPAEGPGSDAKAETQPASRIASEVPPNTDAPVAPSDGPLKKDRLD